MQHDVAHAQASALRLQWNAMSATNDLMRQKRLQVSAADAHSCARQGERHGADKQRRYFRAAQGFGRPALDSGPSTMPRLVDHIDAIQQASEVGMRAVVFKDRYYPSGPIAELLKAKYAHLNVEPIGSVVLNNAVGGFNVHAVESCADGRRPHRVDADGLGSEPSSRAGHRKRLLPTKQKMRDPDLR